MEVAHPDTAPDFWKPDPFHEPRFKRDTIGVVPVINSQLVATTSLILTFSPREKGQRSQASLYAVVRRRIQSRVLRVRGFNARIFSGNSLPDPSGAESDWMIAVICKRVERDTASGGSETGDTSRMHPCGSGLIQVA